MDQEYLNKYFGKVWRNTQYNNLALPEFSGKALLDKIKLNETVIDIGCGSNYFKQHFPNLIGIDPAFSEADYQLTLEQYCEQFSMKYDVALCLGSINFGDKDYIESQIALVVGLLAPHGRIYWRSNPGLKDHGTEECKYIDFYNWSFEEHIRLSELFGFKIAELRWDTGNRIYAEWKRL